MGVFAQKGSGNLVAARYDEENSPSDPETG